MTAFFIVTVAPWAGRGGRRGERVRWRGACLLVSEQSKKQAQQQAYM